MARISPRYRILPLISPIIILLVTSISNVQPSEICSDSFESCLSATRTMFASQFRAPRNSKEEIDLICQNVKDSEYCPSSLIKECKEDDTFTKKLAFILKNYMDLFCCNETEEYKAFLQILPCLRRGEYPAFFKCEVKTLGYNSSTEADLYQTFINEQTEETICVVDLSKSVCPLYVDQFNKIKTARNNILTSESLNITPSVLHLFSIIISLWMLKVSRD